ncbi:hypothetical protein HNR46_001331 [Haloferula luteola]|uniref:Uncharacterized protein n=1 Tax=Haloferula luteola TaxID=595692 RepID=A0A840UY72_9BACT|nr:hypothetical protein [Haloferula luteola]MBB5351097.1 hypothetical protein [Haloferula luteola]
MNDTEETLADLTDEQCDAVKRLIIAGKLDFAIHSTNPGTWSHDIGISVDHDEMMAALQEETAKKARRKSQQND